MVGVVNRCVNGLANERSKSGAERGDKQDRSCLGRARQLIGDDSRKDDAGHTVGISFDTVQVTPERFALGEPVTDKNERGASRADKGKLKHGRESSPEN